MMQGASSRIIKDAQVAANGFVATKAQDDFTWAEGSIRPQDAFQKEAEQRALTEAVLASIEPVTDTELPYSSCTDGRIPVQLADGSPIPVREQMVGADMVSTFFVAEMLGDQFYKDVHVSVAERVQEVATFLQKNGLMPSSHIACGAGAGFVTIMQNIIRFSDNEGFKSRVQELLPTHVYTVELYNDLVQSINRCLQRASNYESLSAQTFLDAVAKTSGDRAIAELKDDGRGVHGHVEEQIIRIRMPGYAINEAKVARLTDGREVFGVNDARIERIARLFGRGSEKFYKTAYMALEAFADAGHGTLAKDLPTWIVEAA